MKIVIDTNVLISGVFFCGFPRKILSSIIGRMFTACATVEIIDEYEEIIQEMIDRKQGHINKNILTPLIRAMEIIEYCNFHISTLLSEHVPDVSVFRHV